MLSPIIKPMVACRGTIALQCLVPMRHKNAAMQLPASAPPKTRTQLTYSLQVDRERKQAAREPRAAICPLCETLRPAKLTQKIIVLSDSNH